VSGTYSYTITDPTGVSLIDVTLTSPATDSTGQGEAYPVTAIGGTIDGTAITGEVGPAGTVALTPDGLFISDNAVFTSPAGGVLGSVDGIDNDGLVFNVGAVEYNFFTDGGHFEFVTYDTATGSESAETPVTVIANDVPCFCPGTRIRTVHGEIAVEDLAVGDLVLTASGGRHAIRWIGQRSYEGHFIADNHLMLPVCIRSGAFAPGVPHTDLHVSPGHGMYVCGQIVPAWRLINGVTVTQAAAVEEVTYLHVELHCHALLLANGAPAESFLEETGFRNQFANAAEFHAMYGDVPKLAPLQARLEDGFALNRIQNRLAERAGLHLSIAPVGVLRGFVDVATAERVCGWAQDVTSPEEPVVLVVSIGGVPVVSLLANAYRDDLRRACIGSGCHAFDVILSPGLSGNVTVHRHADGAVLPMTDLAAGLEHQLAA
jgi:hypothetical protein